MYDFIWRVRNRAPGCGAVQNGRFGGSGWRRAGEAYGASRRVRAYAHMQLVSAT